MGLFEKKYCDLCGDKVNALTSSVRFHQAGKTEH